MTIFGIELMNGHGLNQAFNTHIFILMEDAL